mmetsp:Transcript_14032/g.49886  ORF Transcript_14032/g.49886 Transcript_14032/m.49886 type:complete len:282 (-) Transcript_14032:1812-2657(-)
MKCANDDSRKIESLGRRRRSGPRASRAPRLGLVRGKVAVERGVLALDGAELAVQVDVDRPVDECGPGFLVVGRAGAHEDAVGRRGRADRKRVRVVPVRLEVRLGAHAADRGEAELALRHVVCLSLKVAQDAALQNEEALLLLGPYARGRRRALDAERRAVHLEAHQAMQPPSAKECPRRPSGLWRRLRLCRFRCPSRFRCPFPTRWRTAPATEPRRDGCLVMLLGRATPLGPTAPLGRTTGRPSSTSGPGGGGGCLAATFCAAMTVRWYGFLKRKPHFNRG